MVNIGDIFGVNGVVLNHHFLIYLGQELFYDTIDDNVVIIDLNEVEAAQKMKTYNNSYILELIENLPKNVFEVVQANTVMKCRSAKPLTLVSTKNG